MKNNDIININIYKVSCTQVSRFKGVGKEFNRIIMTNATQTWNSILLYLYHSRKISNELFYQRSRKNRKKDRVCEEDRRKKEEERKLKREIRYFFFETRAYLV